MKSLLSLCFLFTSILSFSQNITVFELSPNQGMCITGKGLGQDAAINPYENQASVAVVKNLGTTPFDIRTRTQEQKTTITTIKPKTTERIPLAKGDILFLDSTEAAKADVTFALPEED